MNKTLKLSLAFGLLGYLDTILVTLKEQLAANGEADEHAKEACVIFLLIEDELRELAAKSVSTVDETIIAEFKEAALRILPAQLVDAVLALKPAA